MIKQIAGARAAPSPITEDDSSLLVFRQIAESVTDDRHNANGIAQKALRQPKPDPRGFRWQVRFWLDGDKLDQLDLGKWIHSLKCSQKFAPTVRNALTLYRELMAGETTMLYQMFPDIKPKPAPLPMPSPVIEEMQKKIDSLQDQVDLLKGILIKQSGPGAVDMSVKMSHVAPVGDAEDIELVIRKDETSGQRSAENFLKSAFALNGMVYEKQ